MRTKIVIKQALFAKEGETPQPVVLPHTWNALDGQDGGADYWRGLGTYQMNLPNPVPGKRQYIEIQGANHVATVWCNGRELGTHKGGFSTFRYELTSAMQPSDNILTVAVSNARSDVYPQNADFTFYGGLYRDICFVEVDAAHFDLLKDGTNAVFITPHSSGKTRIDLFPVNAEGCTIAVSLKDAAGNEVACARSDAELHTVLKMDVKEPHFWSGVADPYLYTCEASVSRDGEVTDIVAVTYGYRSFRVDAGTGFYLNGSSYPLHGVSRHQDREDKGWALSHADHDEDLALILEVGANTIRLAHYQHDQYFYDLCDKAGLVLWAEIPFISQFINTPEAYENTMSQMRELVAQNYNHPAICFWGISNEISIAGESEPLLRNLADINALAKTMDPSRLTTIAQVSTTPMNSEHVYLTDVQGYNHYLGWYVGDVEDNGPWFDKFHALNPDRPVGVSEYGSEAVLRWHSAWPENHDYTEEYANLYHHEMLKIFAKRPYLWGTYVWNMFDFAADARDEGGVKGRNNKGLITYDRKTKKDAFYIYKAYWTTKPMVHICGARFNDRAPGERDITVYTNQPSVTLILNGQEVATLDAVDHTAVFKDVALQRGTNTVTACAGDVRGNTITLNGVTEHNYAYDLPEGNEAANWFDDPAARAAHKPLEYPKGYYSIRDKIGDLLADDRTAPLIQDIIGPAMAAFSVADSDKNDGSDAVRDFYMMMQLKNLLQMAGKTVGSDAKRTLNEALTKIKKPE